MGSNGTVIGEGRSAKRAIEPQVVFANIVRDFEATWSGIAGSPKADVGLGNFLFGFMAALLLEWACRLCREDGSGSSLERLAKALCQIEPLYFTELPQRCGVPKSNVPLPLPPGRRPPPLLWALYDLIRNGQAHQYQQIPAHLENDTYLWISIRGAEVGTPIATTTSQRPSDHLAFCEYRDGNIGIRVRSDTFFLDIRRAVEESGMLDSGIAPTLFTRRYGTRRSDFLASLEAAKHSRFAE